MLDTRYSGQLDNIALAYCLFGHTPTLTTSSFREVLLPCAWFQIQTN